MSENIGQEWSNEVDRRMKKYFVNKEMTAREINDRLEKHMINIRLEKEIEKALKDAKTCPNRYYIGKAYGLRKAMEIINESNK